MKKKELLIVTGTIIILIGIIIAIFLLNNKKENKNLIFSIQSDRLDCETVILDVYDNNTYEYTYTYGTTTSKRKKTTGNYSYDVKKIIDNIDKYEEDSIGPFIIKDKDGKNYFTYTTNIELQEFLEEIDINLDTCLSYS